MPASILLFFLIVVGIPVAGGLLLVAFQRWLQHKERLSKLIADQTAERAAQYGAHVERIEARLRVVEEIVTDGGVQTAAQIEALREPTRKARRHATLDPAVEAHDIMPQPKGAERK